MNQILSASYLPGSRSLRGRASHPGAFPLLDLRSLGTVAARSVLASACRLGPAVLSLGCHCVASWAAVLLAWPCRCATGFGWLLATLLRTSGP